MLAGLVKMWSTAARSAAAWRIHSMNMVLESEMTMQSTLRLCSRINVSKSAIPAVRGMVSITLRTLSGLTSCSPAYTSEEKKLWNNPPSYLKLWVSGVHIFSTAIIRQKAIRQKSLNQAWCFLTQKRTALGTILSKSIPLREGLVLTYVIHDSAHELCPVAFCVSILNRVRKCLTRKTSDKRAT